MELKHFVACVGTLLLLGGAGGCGSDDNGTLQQNWTIQGETAPTACSTAGAVQMRVVLVNSSGFAEATSFTPCGSFATSISLVEDTYTGAATFLGIDGLAVSQTKLIPTFRINAGETTTQTIDFGLVDFLTR